MTTWRWGGYGVFRKGWCLIAGDPVLQRDDGMEGGGCVGWRGCEFLKFNCYEVAFFCFYCSAPLKVM